MGLEELQLDVIEFKTSVWCYKVNKRYVYFFMCYNKFEVDKDIAESISLLNKKGYYTRYSCSGHVKDPRMYEKYRVKKDEKFNDKDLGYI